MTRFLWPGSTGCSASLLRALPPTGREMTYASVIGSLPSLTYEGRRTSSTKVRKFPGSAVPRGRALLGRQRQLLIVSKAASDDPNSLSESIVKYVQEAWGKSENQIALVGFGFAAIAALWASSNLVSAIDKLPVVPTVLEFIGILFSWWFVYRYLLFKPDREELLKNVKSSISDILGR
ncbi:hypothetical protein Taro_013669 [Colocasia esculenta]|uniref:Cyanobacterial aminoacyl-tRNA synthetase CAAD domain-containing protein n=1 Tax=Colocasia esculenta TaxID=4460 RepID=A0A843UG71_COLES|nr:hypothetical protein [Colocasia esculenta]